MKIFSGHRPVLCVIVDRTLLRGRSASAVAREAARGGADIIQYRDKESSAREFFQVVLQIQKALKGTVIPLVVNDRLDIALAASASGVHLGQKDLPVKTARRLAGKEFIIGLTADTAPAARAAEADGADYLGVGAFSPTATKSEAKVIGRKLFASIARTVKIPVLAVGGITAGNLSAALAAGASGVAVASAVLGAPDLLAATAALRRVLDRC